MASFQSSADLRFDAAISNRTHSCMLRETLYRPATPFTQAIQINAMTITTLFVTFLSTDPGVLDAYEIDATNGVTDEMILSSVQGNWDDVEKLWQTTQPAPAP